MMTIKPDETNENKPDEISLSIINRKLEAFVEVVLGKMIELQQENRELKRRLAAIEAINVKMK